MWQGNYVFEQKIVLSICMSIYLIYLSPVSACHQSFYLSFSINHLFTLSV